jgi:hypothetical protein
MVNTARARGSFSRSLGFRRLGLFAFANLALGVQGQELGEFAQRHFEGNEVVDRQREGEPVGR